MFMVSGGTICRSVVHAIGASLVVDPWMDWICDHVRESATERSDIPIERHRRYKAWLQTLDRILAF